MKFGLPTQKPAHTLDTLVADLMVELRDNTVAASQCAKIIETNLSDLNISLRPTKVTKSIQNRMVSRGVCMMNAEKGNSSVIMTRANYDDKMIEFLVSTVKPLYSGSLYSGKPLIGKKISLSLGKPLYFNV